MVLANKIASQQDKMINQLQHLGARMAASEKAGYFRELRQDSNGDGNNDDHEFVLQCF